MLVDSKHGISLWNSRAGTFIRAFRSFYLLYLQFEVAFVYVDSAENNLVALRMYYVVTNPAYDIIITFWDYTDE